MRNVGTLRYVAIVLLAIAFSGCDNKQEDPLLSQFPMSDERSERQLLGGFWALEDGKWRWTARRFAVALQAPPGSERTGAKLRLQVFIPPMQIEKLGTLTLNAVIGDSQLPSMSMNISGPYTYTQAIPPSLIGRDPLPVMFELDKATDNRKVDGRELGVIVTSVSLGPSGS